MDSDFYPDYDWGDGATIADALDDCCRYCGAPIINADAHFCQPEVVERNVGELRRELRKLLHF